MRDVIAHVITAAVLVWAGRRVHWPWGAIVATVLVGSAVIQTSLARGRRESGHLGAAAIANDDPLMVAALEQARRT